MISHKQINHVHMKNDETKSHKDEMTGASFMLLVLLVGESDAE